MQPQPQDRPDTACKRCYWSGDACSPAPGEGPCPYYVSRDREGRRELSEYRRSLSERALAYQETLEDYR